MRRRILSAAAAAILIGGILGGAAGAQDEPPAAPAAGGFEDAFAVLPMTVNGTYIPLVGVFCAEGESNNALILWYAPGTAPDSLWTLYGEFESATWETEPITVNGTYDPIVGDFDGNGCTDILWYGPGSAPDSIWYREADGTFTVQPITINGTYAPVTGDFGGEDDATDVFWYSTTGGTESFWVGTSDRTFVTESAPQVSYSGYRLTSRGSGIFFHRPGPGTDYAWESVTAGDPAPAQNIPLQIDGDYLPYAMSAGILLYAPGPATDRLIWWDGDALEVVNGTINGTYRLGRVPGDIPVSFILFHGPGAAPDSLWVSGTDGEDVQQEGEIGAAALFG